MVQTIVLLEANTGCFLIHTVRANTLVLWEGQCCRQISVVCGKQSSRAHPLKWLVHIF